MTARLAFYPKYQVHIGERDIFLSLPEAARVDDALLGDVVLEGDDSTRSITPDEIVAYSKLRDEWRS